MDETANVQAEFVTRLRLKEFHIIKFPNTGEGTKCQPYWWHHVYMMRNC